MILYRRYTYEFGEASPNLYTELNRDLRKAADTVTSFQEVQDIQYAWSPLVTHILAGMRRLPAYEGIVYRGRAVPPRIMRAMYFQGLHVKWCAFTSTTLRLERALAAAQNKGTVFRIRTWAGKDISSFSAFATEEEILIPPNRSLW